MAARRTTAADADLGARIATARKEAGFTQKQLGAALGVTMQQVQKYEAGTNRIAATVLASVAKVTGKPVAWFFDEATPELIAEDRARAVLRQIVGLVDRYGAAADVATTAQHLAREHLAAEARH